LDLASGEGDAMDVTESIRKLLRASPKARRPVPLSDGNIPHGRILAAAVVVVLAVHGASYYFSSGGRMRPERLSLVPKSLLQPSPAAARHLKRAPGDPPVFQKPDSAILWPQTKGPGAYGL
jgi:hypothetical protein